MKAKVLKAYGCNNISMVDDFYEVDYQPENDRIRYTISPAACRKVLKRLLEQNYKIHVEEAAVEQQIASATKSTKGKKTSDLGSMTF